MAVLNPVPYIRNAKGRSDPIRNVSQPSSYPHFSQRLHYENLKFPMALKDIPKFEQMNGLSINVYGIEADEKKNSAITPYYIHKNESKTKTIHLLMFREKNEEGIEEAEEGEEEEEEEFIEPKYHYAHIKNLSRLVSYQLSRSRRQMYLCDRCLCHFGNTQSLDNHLSDCMAKNNCRMILPTAQDNILKSTNFKNQLEAPFVVYADTESLLERISDEKTKGAYQKHTAHSIAYYVKCRYNSKFSHFLSKCGNDCVPWFVARLSNLAHIVQMIIQNVVPMSLNKDEEDEFEIARKCHICLKSFNPQEKKVKDHDHFTGKFRGAAHNSCNLNYKETCIIPVVFHSFSSYDSHLILKELANQFPGQMELLPLNKEKFISFTKKVDGTNVKLRFIDSFRFMSSGIEQLASYLDPTQKVITRAHCQNDNEFDLLSRKGVFPYDYLDNWDKLKETKLPPKESFFSELNNEEISEEAYNHACNVWETFGMKTLEDYSNLYLKTDVLLLADIFENFRQNCLDTYFLDPLHYYTAPGLSFDAMLKITNINLELLTDPGMVLFIEKGIRGGLAQCSNRFAKANNRYMGSEFNPNEEETYLMYYDVNNLYGAAMSEYLPSHGFKWVENFEGFDVQNISDVSNVGHMQEVDSTLSSS